MLKKIVFILVLIFGFSFTMGYDLYWVYDLTDSSNSPSRVYSNWFSPVNPIWYSLTNSCWLSSTCPYGVVVFDGSRNKLYPYNNWGYLNGGFYWNYYCWRIDANPPSISITWRPAPAITPDDNNWINVLKINPLRDLRITVSESEVKIRKIKVIIWSKVWEINYIDRWIITWYVSLDFTWIVTQVFWLSMWDRPRIDMMDDGYNRIKVIACDTSTDPQNFKAQGDVNCRSLVPSNKTADCEWSPWTCISDWWLNTPLRIDNNGPKVVLSTDTAYSISQNANFLIADWSAPDNARKRKTLNIKVWTQDTFEWPADRSTLVLPVQASCSPSMVCKYNVSAFWNCCFQ